MYIFSFGDFFDVMSNKYDPRTIASETRPEYVTGDGDHAQLNSILKDGTKFLSNYKDNLLFLGKGNHEEQIRRRHDVYLTSMLWNALEREGSNVVLGPYTGFIKLLFREKGSQNVRVSYDIYYTHGSGGSSPVTRGALKLNRLTALAIADCFVMGHTHKQWEMYTTAVKMNAKGEVTKSDRTFIQLGTFKDWEQGSVFAGQRGLEHPNLGASLLELSYRRFKTGKGNPNRHAKKPEVCQMSAVARRMHKFSY